MKVYVRVDSSTKVGIGHLMRCLTLADELRKKGARVSFICREVQGNISYVAEEKGYKVYRLVHVQGPFNCYRKNQYAQWMNLTWETDAKQTKAILMKEEKEIDWLIVDQYALDRQWERNIRPYVKKIMVIDDLANRPHDCDLILDQNLYKNLERRYDHLVPIYCKKLLGPKCALLRSEFREARKNLRQRDGNIQHIVISFGGSDPTNETAKALEAICLLHRPDIDVDVIVGGANPHKEQLQQLCFAMPNVNLYCNVDNMAELMSSADLAIGAGGSTMWERCFLGLPTITLITALNQAETTDAVASQGAIVNLGYSSNVSSRRLVIELKKIINNPNAAKKMGGRALQLMGIHNFDCEWDVVKTIMEGK